MDKKVSPILCFIAKKVSRYTSATLFRTEVYINCGTEYIDFHGGLCIHSLGINKSYTAIAYKINANLIQRFAFISSI